MNILKSYIYLIAFLCVGQVAFAQNYIEKGELSGFDTAPYQSDLQEAADSLVAAFPAEFQNDFKVYSFGFYVPMGSFDQFSYPEAFESMKAEVASESPYYLLIGRQSDDSGVFTKFLIDVKLPNTGSFECMKDFDRVFIDSKITEVIEQKYIQLDKKQSKYSQAEIEGINSLASYVRKQVECCGFVSKTECPFCPTNEEIELYFIENDASEIEVNVIGSLTAKQIENDSIQKGNKKSFVEDYAELLVEINQVNVDLKGALEDLLTELNQSFNVSGFITKNDNFCDSLFTQVSNAVQSNDATVWMHVLVDFDTPGETKMFIQTNWNSTSHPLGNAGSFVEASLKTQVLSNLGFTGLESTPSTPVEFYESIIQLHSPPTDPDPEEVEKLKEKLYKYQKPIDMNEAPEKGSTYNAEGSKRNNKWFWQKWLERGEGDLSPDNIDRIKNKKRSPYVDQTWVDKHPNHAEFLTYDNNGKPNMSIHHHHEDHGTDAYAIPRKPHQKHTGWLHRLFGGKKGKKFKKIKPKDAKKIIDNGNKALGVAGLFLDAKGLYNNDPHTTMFQFSPPQGVLVYFEQFGGYAVSSTKMEFGGHHKDWNTGYIWSAWIDYAYNDELGKYVGIGHIASGYTIVKTNRDKFWKLTECWMEHPDCNNPFLYDGLY